MVAFESFEVCVTDQRIDEAFGGIGGDTEALELNEVSVDAVGGRGADLDVCLLYTSPSPRDS